MTKRPSKVTSSPCRSVVWPRWSLRFLRRIPLHDLQVQHDDAVEDRNQQKRDESRRRRSTDLRITQRLPKRSAMQRQWEEGQRCCRHRNQHRTEPYDIRLRDDRLLV